MSSGPKLVWNSGGLSVEGVGVVCRKGFVTWVEEEEEFGTYC